MLTVSLLVCAMMALAAADDNSTPSPPAPACPEGWRNSNGRCYHFNSSLLTWADAEINCQSMNANLVSVHSDKEDQFLYMMIKENADDNPEAWIGGSDCQQENVWLWSNGKEFSYTNWATSLIPGFKHGCIVMNHSARIRWNDEKCSNLNPSVCAFDL